MKKGFTIIELIIAISIISLLAAITLSRYTDVTSEAKVANVSSNLANLRTAIEMYNVKNESYPELKDKEDNLEDFSEFYSKSKLPETPPHENLTENNTIYEKRTDVGGWLYLKEKGELYANLSNGIYTGDTVDEIWDGEPTSPVDPTKEYAVNPGFEVSGLNISTWRSVDANLIEGWETTYPDNRIELWKSGFQGVEAVEGDYFVELNGNGPSTIYQEIETIPGTTLTWSISHRGRSGEDVAEIYVGSGENRVVLETMKDGNSQWGAYTGTYVVPEGQTSTKISIAAVSSVGGSSVGNFIDNFSVKASN